MVWILLRPRNGSKVAVSSLEVRQATPSCLEALGESPKLGPEDSIPGRAKTAELKEAHTSCVSVRTQLK